MQKTILRPVAWAICFGEALHMGKVLLFLFLLREGMLEKGPVLAFARAIYSQKLDGTQRGDV